MVIHRLLASPHSTRKSCTSIDLTLSLVFSCLLVATAFGASTDRKTNLNPCNLSEQEEQGLGRDPSAEVAALDTYIATISRMVHQERFQALDCIGDRARANKERFSGGQWKIHELYKGLYDPVPAQHATEQDWQDLIQLLQRWVKAHPKSPTARVALASAWIHYAGQARGEGYADTVSEHGWKLYAERTAKADAVLQEASTLSVICPESYLVKLNVAQNQSWPKGKILALFDQASAFETGYYYYGRAIALLLEPQWFGQPGDTAKFLQESADRIGGKQGDAYYFLVASSKDVICGCEDQPKLSLQRIEKGYDAVEQMYGVSMLNLNQLAYLTLHVSKSDLILADKTFQRIGTQWAKYSWDSQKTFEQTKSWVHQMIPMVKEAMAYEEEAKANSQTPDGARYQVSIEKAYKDIVRDCVRSDGAGLNQWDGAFETLIRVGANGSAEDDRINSAGPVVICMYRKMLSSRQDASPLFPVPPKKAYWVRIDLDWADFAPAAAQR